MGPCWPHELYYRGRLDVRKDTQQLALHVCAIGYLLWAFLRKNGRILTEPKKTYCLPLCIHTLYDYKPIETGPTEVIFVRENWCFSEFPLNHVIFLHRRRKHTLVTTMTWHRTDDKHLLVPKYDLLPKTTHFTDVCRYLARNREILILIPGTT